MHTHARAWVLQVKVKFFVGAYTVASRSRLGSLDGSSTCNSIAYSHDTRATALSVNLGDEIKIPFVACDIDGLPVSHQLPSLRDSRRWRGVLRRLGPLNMASDPAVQPAEHAPQGNVPHIEYHGGAVYDVQLRPTLVNAPGQYTLTLHLAGTIYGQDRDEIIGGVSDSIPAIDRACRPTKRRQAPLGT